MQEETNIPSNGDDPYLKAADEFFALARTADNPYMRAYFERVALRYLSSQGGLKRPGEVVRNEAGR